MKSSFDLRHNLGKLTPENADDLWVLSDILGVGSLVTAKTLRSIEVMRGDKKEKVGKKSVVLTIGIEKVELGEKLRLTGKIVEGPKDVTRGYHTIEVNPGDFIKVERPWKAWEINKIKAAHKKQETVFVCILDEREADFYLIGERTKHVSYVSGGTGKKVIDSRKPEYYGKVVSLIKNHSDYKIIVAGPGFAREEIQKLLKENKIKAHYDSLAHTGEVGLQELLKRRVIEKIVSDSRISEETNIVEKLLVEVVKEGLAVYGLDHTKDALEKGAIETLLVSDKKVREVENLLEEADKMRTKIMIISSLHESGQKLYGLGGIAGLLRYKIQN